MNVRGYLNYEFRYLNLNIMSEMLIVFQKINIG